MKKVKITNPKQKTKSRSKSNSTNINKIKFIPAILIASCASFLWLQPATLTSVPSKTNDVLAYATNTTISGLLSSTNSRRSANSVANLGLNAKLNSAAQAKANDMVARDYWSHQTPDGQQPWVFIDNAGYQYLAAGENLAYGFSNSDATVTGWMNSPSHKENLLSATYTEVGFGIANSANFVNNGQQTVVVAMYGKPQGAEVPAQVENESTTVPNQPSQSQKKPTTPKPTTPAPTPTPAPAQPEPEPIPQQTADEDPGKKKVDSPTAELTNTQPEETKEINRIQLMTGGKAIWSATLVILLVCSVGVLWGLHRGYRLTQIIKNSGQAIGRNIHIDLAVLALIFLAYVLLSTSGFIK